MKIKGPWVTLAAGVAVAGVLFGLSTAAARTDSTPSSAQQNPPAAAPSAPQSQPPPTLPSTDPPPPPPATTAPAAPVPAPDASYAGKVDNNGGTLAIAFKGGTAVAYLCDGKRVEVWMQGPAVDGKLNLTGKKGTLTGTYDETKVTGVVSTAGKDFTFTVGPVAAPSGLYRASANVRNARVVGGWIVLPDGSQVGVVSTNDQPVEAPRLDPATRTATVDGTTLTAVPVTGAPGSLT